MATDIEKLVVQLSADFKSFERSLARANDVSNRQFNAIERRARQMNKNLDSVFSKSFSGLTAPLAGVGAALGVDQLRKMTDTWTDLTSRVNLATGSIEKGTEVMGRLGDMARVTYSDLSQTTESYLSNATALKELGYSTDQTLDYTEALNNALVVSGAKGDRAARVIDALAKAMALGKLSGDNLNTVIASGGRVAEALAAGLNTTVGGLRKLGAQGKITGNDVVKALSSQMETLRKEAESMPATIGDGFTLLNNALLQYVGNADSATGVSRKISDALVVIADNFDKVADNGLRLAAVLAGAILGRSVAGMIANLGLGIAALNNFRKALAAAQTMGGLATALGGVSAAAGPVGLIIGGAVVSSLILYNNTIGASSEGADLFAARLKKVEEAARSSGDAVEEAGRQNDSYRQNSLTKEVEASKNEMQAATEAAVNMLAAFAQVSSMSLVTPEQYQELARLRDGVKEGTVSAEEAKQSLFDMANADYNFQEVADAIGPILDRLALVAKAAREAAGELSAVTAGDGSSSFSRGGRTRARQELLEERRVTQEYVDYAKKRATLSKAQYDLETKIAQVKAQAEKDGRKLTDAQIKEIAAAQVAGDNSRTAEGKKPKRERAPKKTEDDYFFQITQQVKDRTSALAEEAKITGLTYVEQEKRRTALELEQDVLSRLREEARKKGDKDWESIKLSSDQVAKIDAVSEAYARQADELRKVQEAQGNAEQAASEFYDTVKSGTVGAIMNANSLQDALKGILNKLAEMMLNSAFDKFFGGNAATSSGGWLTGLMKSIGFADGGYTGNGDKYQPAGVVHKGEYVFDKDAVKKAGGPAALDAMRRGLKGYANGGYVGNAIPRAPRMPTLKAASSGSSGASFTFAPQIDARGADSAAVARLEQVVAQQQAQFSGRVVETMRNAKKTRNWRGG
ncbi:tape measure domain-containing protein [Ochrobactrum sp. 19YEA23]|uniref:tape measure protein n=1 Tax=Ochrobactrum sp. 19YEA23 TaxID=3039854 RepID=UPI002478A187|nr:tape measure domain-containing protein [Ochrobactrum sp. 19YEA23]